MREIGPKILLKKAGKAKNRNLRKTGIGDGFLKKPKNFSKKSETLRAQIEKIKYVI